MSDECPSPPSPLSLALLLASLVCKRGEGVTDCGGLCVDVPVAKRRVRKSTEESGQSSKGTSEQAVEIQADIVGGGFGSKTG